MQTPRRHRNIKINPYPIFRNLIVRLIRRPDALPIHTCIARTILKHQPQRFCSLRIIRAARRCPQTPAALRQVPAQIARTVARRIAPLRKPLAEHRLRRHNYILLAAVEEQVVVLRGKREMGACVEAERSCRAEIVAVVAVPHVRVCDFDVAFCVAYGFNWVSP